MHELARSTIESRFLVDECSIVAGSGAGVEGTLDEDTFEVSFAAAAEVYSGPCSFSERVSSRPDRDGSADLRVDELIVKLPDGTAGVSIGDVVSVTSSADPGLVAAGERFVVIRVVVGSHSITRRLVVRRVEAVAAGGVMA